MTDDKDRPKPPNLQELVERAGRRYAASIGEEYDPNPFTRPRHQGGYQHITPEEWAEYDHQLALWQAALRAGRNGTNTDSRATRRWA